MQRKVATVSSLFGIGVVVTVVAILGPARAAASNGDLRVDLRSFRVVERDSGSINYYTLVSQSPLPYIHAAYKPPLETMVLGYAIPEGQRESVAHVRWKWRALTLPEGGDECSRDRRDSAAVVYVTWKRALRWYSVKYVWSAVGPKGAICDRKRNPFVAQDTVIVETASTTSEWRSVDIVPDVEFRNHFEDGDANASVPDLVGVGIMSDGDQTRSVSEADYADFVIVPK